MPNENQTSNVGKLHRVLGLKDVVLLNIACVVGLGTMAQVAQLGYAGLLLLFVCIFTFLIPSGLVMAELNARMPEEGGFYLWTRKAFGDMHGFIAAWSYWICNIIWLATALMLITVPALYIFDDQYLHLVKDVEYNSIFGIILIWVVTALNVLGMEKAKWIQNIGAIAAWISIILLFGLGLWYITRTGISNEFTMASLIPDISSFDLLPYFALVPFCFGGLELAPVMAGEIKNPQKLIPKAVFISSISIGIIYIVGVGMLLFVIPINDIGIIEGVAQSFYVINEELKIPGLGVIGACLVVFSTLGLFGSWLTGNARIPFVIGIDDHMPKTFSKIHPKYGTPIPSLLIQAIIISLLLIASNAGTTIQEAFLILLNMSVILYFIPFLYIFSAFAWYTMKKSDKGLFPFIKDSNIKVWLITGFGFITTLMATILSCFPSEDIPNKLFYVINVVGGAFLIIVIGLLIFNRKKIFKQKTNE